jgi:hypothetical protein
MVTSITKVIAHMYDVPTQHTGKMTFQVHKDPLNKRVLYLHNKEWMELLQDTVWIVFCTDARSAYAVNPRVLSMIDAYKGVLDVMDQKAGEDVYVKFPETHRDRWHTDDAPRLATAPDRGTQQALLKLQA